MKYGIGLIMICLTLSSNSIAEKDPYVFVQAHRGYSADYPELTLLAFKRAIEVGADRLEMDLAITADGHVVLMHDRTVDRTTDGSGPVESFTLAQLRQLDAGGWKGGEFAGERVPTLEEVLELVDGRAVLNLEIKSRGRLASWVERVIEATVRVVQERGAVDRVLFSSFDVQALLAVRELEPEAKLLLIDWEQPSLRFDMLDVAIAQGFYAWTPSPEYATEERIRRAKEMGLSVHVGASPGPRILEWAEWGVDGFSSGNPGALIDFLERHGFR
ncbi:MAG: hypothetical protein M3498_00900 [Deinococcota bacterium]|nr:hypothetical protein [Deinococcota bacterium]